MGSRNGKKVKRSKRKGGAQTAQTAQTAPKPVSVTICPPPMAAVGRMEKAGG